ncbi:MAG: BrnA antitoxin family protein [Bdellovibrionales bacterium]
MKKKENIVSYTAAELKKMQAKSQTDLSRIDKISEEELEKLIAANPDEQNTSVDWTQAELVLPKAKTSVHLRLDQDIVDFFKSQGKGHISRMQAVLKMYATTHQRHDSTHR